MRIQELFTADQLKMAFKGFSHSPNEFETRRNCFLESGMSTMIFGLSSTQHFAKYSSVTFSLTIVIKKYIFQFDLN